MERLLVCMRYLNFKHSVAFEKLVDCITIPLAGAGFQPRDLAGVGFQPRNHYLSGFTRFSVYFGWNHVPAQVI